MPCPNLSCVDCSYDLAILGWAAQTAAALARTRFPGDAAGRAVFDDIVARIAPLPVDPTTGSWQVAVDLPFAVPHRHYSHLLASFDLATSGDVGAITASVDVWHNITCAAPQAAGGIVNGNDQCRGFTQVRPGAAVASVERARP